MSYIKDVETIHNNLLEMESTAPYHKQWGRLTTDVNIPKSEYLEMFKSNGFEVGNPYHAHGIGNNNEYKISRRVYDDEGYAIEKQVGTFHYTYDIYGKRIHVWFDDNNGNQIYKDNGKLRSENE